MLTTPTSSDTRRLDSDRDIDTPVRRYNTLNFSIHHFILYINNIGHLYLCLKTDLLSSSVIIMYTVLLSVVTPLWLAEMIRLKHSISLSTISSSSIGTRRVIVETEGGIVTTESNIDEEKSEESEREKVVKGGII